VRPLSAPNIDNFNRIAEPSAAMRSARSLTVH
jgi:hypothetical protein